MSAPWPRSPEGSESVTATAESRTEPSLEELLEKMQPRLRQVLYRYRIPLQDGEDLIQQTLLTLVYKLDQIERPEPWLVATLKNRCIMYWRKRRSQLYDTVDSTILELVAQPGKMAQDQKALTHDLRRAVERLPERCQKIMQLRYGLGYGPSEVAEKLGYQSSSIRKITNRCLAALTKQLVVSGFLELQRDE